MVLNIVKSPTRFYLDEHIPSVVAEGLRRRGIDVLTLVEADKLGADDEEHLAFARQQRRTIVTHDTDFLRFASTASEKMGQFIGIMKLTVSGCSVSKVNK